MGCRLLQKAYGDPAAENVAKVVDIMQESKSQSDQWVSMLNLADPVGSILAVASEPLQMACSVAVPDGAEALQGKEMSGGILRR